MMHLPTDYRRHPQNTSAEFTFLDSRQIEYGVKRFAEGLSFVVEGLTAGPEILPEISRRWLRSIRGAKEGGKHSGMVMGMEMVGGGEWRGEEIGEDERKGLRGDRSLYILA